MEQHGPRSLLRGRCSVHRWPRLRNTVQVKIKCCSLGHRAFRPNITTVPVDNSLDGCQSDAGPRKLVVRVKTLKRAKESFRVLHVESCAVVPHKEFSRFTGRGCNPEFYSSEIRPAGELPRVPHKVFHDDA